MDIREYKIQVTDRGIMKLKTKIIALAAAMWASKHAVAASAGTAVAAAAVSHDWLTWGISAAGAVAYRLRTPSVQKVVAVSNAIISVFLGGLGAPWLVSLALPGSNQPPHYLASFLVALVWPYMWDKYYQKKEGS